MGYKTLVFIICTFLTVFCVNAFCREGNGKIMEIESGISPEQIDGLMRALFGEFRYATTALKEAREEVSGILKEKRSEKEETQKKVEDARQEGEEDKRIVEKTVKREVEETRKNMEIARQKVVSVLDKVKEAIDSGVTR